MLYLLIDVGSTYTKGTLVDSEKRTILGQGMAITTVESSVLIGVERMLEDMAPSLPHDLVANGVNLDQPFWDRALTCSSAAGGLKMVAVGLGKSLTAEAASRSALGAGARILKTYHYYLDDEDIQEIDGLDPDIILLSGGTDGGNRLALVENAGMLAKLKKKVPIVVAGNQEVLEEAGEKLKGFNVSLTENVMPEVNVLTPYPARRAIRKIFMNRITRAKGLDELIDKIGPVLMPTPDAVLQAARLLSQGYGENPGLGDLLLVDIGGATTDVHSIGWGQPGGNRIRLKGKEYELRVEGLQEPFEKRTVEGDLGMRYSALSLLESVGEETLQAQYPADYKKACRMRREDIRYIPDSPEEEAIDQSMALAARKKALSRHAGQLDRDFSSGRYIYYLSGKDLSSFQVIIGTGGILAHAEDPAMILRPGDHPLYPIAPDLYLDRAYILSAMGLLASEDPAAALAMMKDQLVQVF